MLRGLTWLFVSFVGTKPQTEHDHQEKRLEATKEERVRLRSQVELAAEIIAPFWPMRTFIYRNPLQGLEHLPFDQAVRRGRALLGGEGYLPNETYRTFYRRGRITVEEIDAAISRLEPERAGGGQIETASRVIRAAEVLRLHLIYGFDRLAPGMAHLLPEPGMARLRDDLPAASRSALLAKAGIGTGADRTDPEAACAASLWAAVLEKLDAPAPVLRNDLNRPAEDDLGSLQTVLPARPIRVNGAAPGVPEEGRSPALREALEKDLSEVGKGRTLGEWAGTLCGRDLVDEVNNQMIKWCAAFLSEGAAPWPMPHRDRGFYEAWRALGVYDFSGLFINIEDIRSRINQLPAQPEDAIISHLTRMGIQEADWKAYLERHLAQLPGWTGFIKWRAANRDYPWQKRYPVDLVQYLAVRLFYEAEFLDHLCRDQWNIEGTLPAIAAYFRGHLDEYTVRRYSEEIALRDDLTDRLKRDWSGLARRIALERNRREILADAPPLRDGWRLFHLAQFLTLSAAEVRSLSRSDLQWLLSLLDAFPPERHRPVWQEAYEAHHRNRLIGRLARRSENGAANGREGRSGTSVPPSVQAIFCIDAREEAFRRHLEARGVETYGFAGFFGVPIRFHPFHSEVELDLCPVLLKPKHTVTEVPRPTQKKVVEKNLSGARWHHIVDGLYHDLKMNLLSPYVIVEVVGGLFGLPFIGKTFFPRLYQKIKGYFRDRLMPPVATRLEFNLPPAEQAYYVEAALRLTGLTKYFARLVLVCAHGSSSENNPYFAALDCGACGGSHGSPNARIFAAMANHPEVRSLLKERGIIIPDETVFLPAEHNTTTDEVVLFDREDLPPSHQDDLARLIEDLKEAGLALSRERCSRLPGVPKEISPAQAASYVARRSADWSQVRPEWGLSGNAAFIIGTRSLTKGIDLQGRAFLHSYDSDQDASGRALEIIMTAPLIVGEWISMEYYFSTVDNQVYGSGTKVVHNVVGRVGVMVGNRSDLRTGLPWQTVMNGEEYYHEPMRLLAMIEAPIERIAAIIARHRVLQQIFDNQWMGLVAVEPGTGRFRRYLPNGEWEALLPERLLSGSRLEDEGSISGGRLRI